MDQQTTKTTMGMNRTRPATYPTEDMTQQITQLRNNVASIIDFLNWFKAPLMTPPVDDISTIPTEVNRRLSLAITSLEEASMRWMKALTHLPQRPQTQTTVPKADMLNAPTVSQQWPLQGEVSAQFPDTVKLQAANQAVAATPPAQHAYDPNAEYQKHLAATQGVSKVDPYNL